MLADASRFSEIRTRLIFLVGALIVYRIGTFIPVPGINPEQVANFFRDNQGTILGIANLFSGGALERLSIFAMGVMPYISASIIVQMVSMVYPPWEEFRKEGESGRRKLTQITRYGTIIISVIQSYAYSVFLVNMGAARGLTVVPDPGFGFTMVTVITQTAGTILVMWLGEKITEHGIGNGISLIIFVNIIGRVPNTVAQGFDSFKGGALSLLTILVVMAIMVVVIAAVVLMTQGMRKIPVQYAKRIVGRRMYGGAATHIPLRINTAGVIPIIFASSVMILPATVAGFVPPGHPLAAIGQWFNPLGWIYNLIYGVIIVFFTYFYTAVVLNPNDLAENMRKYGGFVPGIRPGRKTAEYIDRVLSRITLPGAIFLALIATLPDMMIAGLGLPFLGFGGTSVLIVVGVALDTLQQVESHLLMRHYEGFVKRGRIRGRQRM